MPLSKFVTYTTAGCLVWDIILNNVGVYVGVNWRKVAGVAHYLIILAAIALRIFFALFLIRRRKNLNQH
jgi:membrane protein DedA with SNARE-associated domain